MNYTGIKLTAMGLSILALSLCPSAALADGAGVTFDGTPVQVQPLQLHIHGQPVTVEQITLDLHMMNHQGAQPVGLWVYFYVLPDAATGNASICEHWSNQVMSDQQSRNADSSTLAWLEIHVTNNSAPVTADEGNKLTADSDISCWEALELKR